MSKFLALSEPYFDKDEIKNVTKVIKSSWVSTVGKEIGVFENLLSKYTNSKYAIACVNGTSALHISLKLAGVKKNDEVIIPTLTFIAPVNAIIYNNASPIFMDSDEFYNIDSKKTIEFIENNTVFKKGFSYNIRTKQRISAIIIVHVWGNAADLNELIKVCEKANIKIIEDASESLGSFYKKLKNKPHTGTLGALGCLSFNGNKIITTSGGGMILTNNSTLAKKAKYLINQAKDDSIFFIHNEVGYNYRLTNLQAALGTAQFKKLDKILLKKKKIHKIYKDNISNLKTVKLIEGPEYSTNNNWLNIIQFNKKVELKKIIKKFEKKNIQVRPVWKLNHTQKQYKKYETYKINFAKKIINNSLCIPSSFNLSKKDIMRVVNNIKKLSKEI